MQSLGRVLSSCRIVVVAAVVVVVVAAAVVDISEGCNLSCLETLPPNEPETT